MRPRDRRAIMIGAGVVVGALLLFRVVPGTWRRWAAFERGLEGRRALLARARDAVHTLPLLDSTSGAVRRRFVALAPRLLSGTTANEAQESLGGLVSGFADRAKVRLRPVTGAPDSTAAGELRRAAVTVDLEGDWVGVMRFYHEVATDPVSLTVGEVTVDAVDPSSAPDRPEVLVVHTVLRGWFLPGGRS